MPNSDFLYIDKESDLAHICAKHSDSTWLAIDTEFERESTYYPELCLLQIASRDMVTIIDPLTLKDTRPLFNLLYKESITKVFHSARQDLEIFFHLKGSVPVPLFDTQIAAAKLGYDNGIGYANLVEKMLGVVLNKKYTRTDWKRRPLRPEQLRYAADDVIYLGKIYQQLVEKLVQTGQLAAFNNEVYKLTDASLYVPDPQTMWLKIKDAKRFNGNQLAVLQDLAAWRETTARSENLPRKWLLADHAIIDMARLLPVTKDDLASIKDVDAQVLQRHGQTLLKLISGHRE